MKGRNRDADVENGLVDTEGHAEGGTHWEIRIDIYTRPCVKWCTFYLMANGKLLYSTGSSTQCGWDGVRRQVQE